MPSQVHSYHLDSEAIKELDCRKRAPRHGRLTQGLISILCVHGHCKGFALMHDGESPRMIFRMLLALDLPDKPVHFYYDNACHLAQYILVREPALTERIRFMIDRFHRVDHVACSSAFDADMFPFTVNENSQVCEQMHSQLVSLRKSLSGMRQYRAMLLLRTFFIVRNLEKSPQYSMKQLSIKYD